MASVNKVFLLGHLGRDPESRFLPSGECVCNFSIATSEKWKDKASGEIKEATEWHRITSFGRTAEVAAEYLKKGSPVFIEGSLRTRKWQDKDGKDQYTTEIRVDRLQLLGSRPEESPRSTGTSTDYRNAREGRPAPKRPADDFEDDIPF